MNAETPTAKPQPGQPATSTRNRVPYQGAGFDERMEMAEEQRKMRERGERLPE